ncbi:DUF6542 domain-containing protein [Saccharopolyspora thermophila]|uniref:DUF6542 domain-containing protein n=1 Tax=Saccharopolyspora thermophila TaxID=89367 RepID=UPI0016663456|nr:DUF6542 domain-containing protein [Saccharopolyspora subtropica]
MTAIRESQSAPPPGNGAPSWSARSAFGANGVPLWGAVLLAAGPTAIGTLLDIMIWGQPGLLFKSCFFVGCVLAVLLVKRRNVFGPMVQPPLVLTIVMPLLVLATGSGVGEGGGMTATLLAVIRPLITSFPIMAGATIVALGIGLVRMFVTQKAGRRGDVADSDAATKKRRSAPARKKPTEEPRKRRSGDEVAKRRSGDGIKKRRPEERTRQPRTEGTTRAQRSQPGRAQAPGRPRSGEARARGEGAPGRARGAEARPEREGRAVPPRRGATPRQAQGRPRPPEPPMGEPPRRPRRPRRDERFG